MLRLRISALVGHASTVALPQALQDLCHVRCSTLLRAQGADAARHSCYGGCVLIRQMLQGGHVEGGGAHEIGPSLAEA